MLETLIATIQRCIYARPAVVSILSQSEALIAGPEEKKGNSKDNNNTTQPFTGVCPPGGSLHGIRARNAESFKAPRAIC